MEIGFVNIPSDFAEGVNMPANVEGGSEMKMLGFGICKTKMMVVVDGNIGGERRFILHFFCQRLR